MRDLSLAYSTDRTSAVHRLDSRVKLFVAVSAIVSLALIASPSWFQLVVYLCTVSVVTLLARMPLIRILQRSLLVVPFVGFFSLILYLTGDGRRAWFILSKSYLSALTIILLITCTPMPQILAAARFFRAPGLLVEIVQLIYRYLFVLAAEVHAMQIAFSARGGRSGRVGLRASSGMVSVLFARSYAKALMVHHAMQSRAFSGQLAWAKLPSLRPRDFSVGILGLSFAIALHLA